MKQEMDMRINELPAKTWNWLKMNETVLKHVLFCGEGKIDRTVPNEIMQRSDKGSDKDSDEDKEFANIATGMGKDMDRLIEASGVTIPLLESKKGDRQTAPVRLYFQYEDGEHRVNAIHLRAKKDSDMTVIMDYSSDKKDKGFFGVQTKILGEMNSHICLVQIIKAGDQFACMNDVGVLLKENAEMEIIHIILNGKDIYQGCRAELEGNQSSLKADIGYIADNNEHLDMNYVAVHKGKKTTSEIHSSGILRDQAFKLFRGTIDFQRGAKGSAGEEKEDVLLLDDTVVNQTIPLILCAEEDVEGNHGATIGKLDTELLFYLESRGISRDEVYEMMAKAKMEAVCNKIADEETRAKVLSYLEGGEALD